MKPEWRTDTVIQLCIAMRESQDFGAMPILADALQDVDCDDEDILYMLRQSELAYWRSTKLVAEVLSDETSKAVDVLMNFAKQVNYPYEFMIQAGMQYVKNGQEFRDPDGENWDAENLFYDCGDPEADYNSMFREDARKTTQYRMQYWEAFFLVTGLNRSEDFKNNNPFICPC